MRTEGKAADRLARVVDLQTELLASDFELDRVLRIAAEGAQSLIGADGAIVELIGGDALEVRAATGMFAFMLGQRLAFHETLSGVVVRERRAICSNDAVNDPRAYPPLTTKVGARSLLAVPLVARRGLIGVVKVSGRKLGQFSDEDVEILELISGMLATAIALSADASERRALEAERAKAAAELLESQVMMRALFEGSQMMMGVIELEPADLIFRAANPPLAAAYGLTPGQMIGRRASELGSSRDVLRMMLAQGALVLSTGKPQHIEYHRPSPTGSQWLSANLAPLPPGPDGTPRICFVSRDVTETVQLRQQVDVADRMATVGRLAAGVAHEINNPLAFLLSNLRYVHEELDGFAASLPGDRLADVRSALTDAIEGGERVSSVVSNLRAFTRSDETWSATVDLVRVVEHAITLARHSLRHQAEVVARLVPVPRVNGNEGKLGQVVLNLLVNAAQSFPEGWSGPRTITVGTGVAASGEIYLEISDTGAGVAPEQLNQIFDPFFTTGGSDFGRGLGLSIAHNIVGQHGGRLEAHSEVGGGTRFRILLPAAG